jgi:hypothetical protein
MMVIPACLLPVIFIALLLSGVSPWPLAAGMVAGVALIGYLIVRHINGDGDVCHRQSRRAFRLDPYRRGRVLRHSARAPRLSFAAVEILT